MFYASHKARQQVENGALTKLGGAEESFLLEAFRKPTGSLFCRAQSVNLEPLAVANLHVSTA